MSVNCSLSQSVYDALHDFYDAMNGDNWVYFDGNHTWSFPSPLSSPCSVPWQGILCDINELSECYIQALGMEEMNLIGTIPSSFTNISQIQCIYFDLNSITGTLPNSWGGLDSLSILSVSSNMMSYTLPDSWSSLTNLQILRVGTNSFSGIIPTSWNALTNLENLEFARNILTGTLPDGYSTLATLFTIQAYSNYFTGILSESWKVMSDLYILYVSNNLLSGTLPTAWGSMTSMQCIGLGSNFFNETLPSEWSTMSLMVLLYVNVNELSGPLPDTWSTFINMDEMFANSNSLSGPLPSSWSSMENMIFLTLYNNSFTGHVSESWSSMTNVQLLYLNENSFTSTIPDSWSGMELLRLVTMFHNSLTGTVPDAWSNMEYLQEVYLSHNFLSGPLPESWKTLKHINLLYFSFNSLTGTLPSSYRDLQNITEISFNINFLTGTLPSAWSAFRFVIYITLHNNFLSGILPESWDRFDYLSIMFAGTNLLSGTMPDAWSALVFLYLFDVSSNFLTGSVPSSYSTNEYMYYIDISNNQLGGSIPDTWCAWKELNALYLSNNEFHGDLNICWGNVSFLAASYNQLSSVTWPSYVLLYNLQQFDVSNNNIKQNFETFIPLFSLPTILLFDISTNSVTGQMKYKPSDRNMYYSSRLNVIDVSDNCMSTNIDDSICLLTSLTLFLASNMYNTHHCRDSSAFSQSLQFHPYPSCILLLPEITTVSLIGNGMTGSLVDIDTNSSKLSFVGLVSNRITGTLPESWQYYGRFDQLLLSFNKISGVLRPDFAVQDNMTNLNMSLNRLSGNLPSAFGSLNHMDVIDGNIMSCTSASTYHSGHDVDASSYECGSMGLSVVGYVICITFGVLTMLYISDYKRINDQSVTLLQIIVKQCLDNGQVLSVVLIASLLMLVIVMSLSLGSTSNMFTKKYGWVTTTAYLHDTQCVMILLLVEFALAFVLYTNGVVNSSNISPSISTMEADEKLSPDVYQSKRTKFFMLLIFHAINVLVIGGLTAVYVMIVLSTSSITDQLIYTIFLSVLKVVWGEFFIPRVFRLAILKGLMKSETRLSNNNTITSLYPKLLRHEIVADVWCYLLCPLLVILTTSSTCYKYLLTGIPDISISYDSYYYVVNVDIVTNMYIVGTTVYVNQEYVPSEITNTVSPPWLYSYQCSSAIPFSYVAIVYYTYFMYCVVLPFVKLFRFNHSVSFIRGSLADIILPASESLVDVNAILDHISFMSIQITSKRHRTHIRHYIMFLIFGLSSPLLGLLIMCTIVVQDSMLFWEVNKVREAMISRGLSDSDAASLCQGLLLRDVSNVYQHYMPWMALIAVGYWSLYAFDVIGDVHGEYFGMISSVVFMLISILVIVCTYVLVGRFSTSGQSQGTLDKNVELAVVEIAVNTLHKEDAA